MVIEQLRRNPQLEGETLPFDESAPPIWEVVAELGREIPDEEWAKVPQDASVNFRQYINARRSVKE